MAVKLTGFFLQIPWSRWTQQGWKYNASADRPPLRGTLGGTAGHIDIHAPGRRRESTKQSALWKTSGWTETTHTTTRRAILVAFQLGPDSIPQSVRFMWLWSFIFCHMINIVFNSSYIYVQEMLECNIITNTFVGKWWPPSAVIARTSLTFPKRWPR